MVDFSGWADGRFHLVNGVQANATASKAWEMIYTSTAMQSRTEKPSEGRYPIYGITHHHRTTYGIDTALMNQESETISQMTN
jgi:hypothetical protein